MADKIIIKKRRGVVLKVLLIFIKRFHLLIFFVLVAAILSVAVIMISQTLAETSSQDYTSTINAGSIDDSTLDRIQSLHTSDQPSGQPDLPQGRINPFVE